MESAKIRVLFAFVFFNEALRLFSLKDFRNDETFRLYETTFQTESILLLLDKSSISTKSFLDDKTAYLVDCCK